MALGGLKPGRWFSDQLGQDLSEYCLLVAFIVLLAAGIFVKVSGGLQSLWTTGNATLSNASSSTTTGGGSSPGH